MNVTALLADAAASIDVSVDAATADADVTRGRRALSRRRMRRGGLAGLVTAGGLAGAIALGGTTPTTAEPSATAPAPDAVLDPGAIELVDFTGDQLAGYSVDEVPAGWTLLAVDEGALTIGPQGTTDTDPSSYVGKLTVMLLSADAALPTAGTPVSVGGGAGVWVESTGEQDPAADAAGTRGADLFAGSLFYVDQASGEPVVVQVPAGLDWTPQQVADFAGGVHVTDAAERGVG